MCSSADRRLARGCRAGALSSCPLRPLPSSRHTRRHGCRRPADIAGSDEAVSLDPQAGQRIISRHWVLGVLAGSPGAGWEVTPWCSGVSWGRPQSCPGCEGDAAQAGHQVGSPGCPWGGQDVVPCREIPVATASLQTCACHAEPGICSVTADFQLMFEARICDLNRWRIDMDSTCVPISGPLGWGLSC